MAKRLGALGDAEAQAAQAASAVESELKATRATLLDAISTANASLNERMKLDTEIRVAPPAGIPCRARRRSRARIRRKCDALYRRADRT